MRSEYGISVDIVRISTTSAWMILGEAEGVKIFSDCDDWMQVIVMRECWRGKIRFNDLTRY